MGGATEWMMENRYGPATAGPVHYGSGPTGTELDRIGHRVAIEMFGDANSVRALSFSEMEAGKSLPTQAERCATAKKKARLYMDKMWREPLFSEKRKNYEQKTNSWIANGKRECEVTILFF